MSGNASVSGQGFPPDHPERRLLKVNAPALGRGAGPIRAIDLLMDVTKGGQHVEVRGLRLWKTDDGRKIGGVASHCAATGSEVGMRTQEGVPGDVVE